MPGRRHGFCIFHRVSRLPEFSIEPFVRRICHSIVETLGCLRDRRRTCSSVWGSAPALPAASPGIARIPECNGRSEDQTENQTMVTAALPGSRLRVPFALCWRQLAGVCGRSQLSVEGQSVHRARRFRVDSLRGPQGSMDRVEYSSLPSASSQTRSVTWPTQSFTGKVSVE